MRLPPYSEDAEMGLIGSALMSPEVLDECMAVVGAEHFYAAAHGQIWACASAMRNAKQAIDLITLSNALVAAGALEAVGGAAKVAECFGYVPTPANWKHYAEIVNEQFLRRQIIALCTDVCGAAFDKQEPARELLDRLQSRALQISERSGGPEEPLKHIAEGVVGAAERLEQAHKRRGRPTGIDTGFFDLNRMTAGLHPGQLIIIAGRPAMGKSSFCVNVLENVAAREKLPVAMFSLEMTYDDLCMRMLCTEADVDISRVRDGFLSQEKLSGVGQAAMDVAARQIFIDDTAGLTINEFKARARRAVKRHGVRLIVIDYLQLMRSTTKRAQENRALELAEIAGGLKTTAKELGVPIIAAAQLNRNAEERKGNRPQLSDLRESGAIEQDADIVGLLYREEYYKQTETNKGLAELIIAKQRNGPVGPVQLRFEAHLTRFSNMTDKQFSNSEEHRQKNYARES